jgi:meiotically up-regulated gene 157 (Mug157) protein
MIRTLLATLLIAQIIILPLTGKRTRNIQIDSLFHTLFRDFFPEDDGTTYVQTGDIPAMWLRDSSAQTIPYIRFQAEYPILRRRFAGVIERNARAINKDVYANAFQADYHIWERKWEVDSIAFPVLLAHTYLDQTHDDTVLTPELHVALRRIVHSYGCEENHLTCGLYDYPYAVPTDNRYNAASGLIWCAFRPSDDPVVYRFNIPQNMLAVVALREIADLAARYGDVQLEREAWEVATRVTTAILHYGVIFNTQRHAWMYAYEVDGYGRYVLMDDANLPNLTAIPEVDWSSNVAPVYLNTRAFTLSADNPWYFTGRYAQGLGSPHTPHGFVWPLGIIARALTSTDELEVENSITTLAETDSESGMIHESFYPDGYWRFTRQEFGWANALYAELIFRTAAGYTGQEFLDGRTVMPFEHTVPTPVLVPPIVQLENTSEIVGTLGRLLYAGRDAAINQLP